MLWLKNDEFGKTPFGECPFGKKDVVPALPCTSKNNAVPLTLIFYSLPSVSNCMQNGVTSQRFSWGSPPKKDLYSPVKYQTSPVLGP